METSYTSKWRSWCEHFKKVSLEVIRGLSRSKIARKRPKSNFIILQKSILLMVKTWKILCSFWKVYHFSPSVVFVTKTSQIYFLYFFWKYFSQIMSALWNTKLFNLNMNSVIIILKKPFVNICSARLVLDELTGLAPWG